MEYVHRCDFCGWSRGAGSAAMVAPHCENCGCGLTSMRQSDVPKPPVDELAELQRVLPRLDPNVVHAMRLSFVALITAAAARFGLAEGGPAIAVVGFGIAGLFAVPIAVPGRYGGARVDPEADPAGPAPARVPPHHA
jgi:hypothetical protein